MASIWPIRPMCAAWMNCRTSGGVSDFDATVRDPEQSRQEGTGTCGTRPFASQRCGLSSDRGCDGSLPFQLNAGCEIFGQFPVARSRASFLGPNVEEAAKEDELAEVVGVVVN